MTHFLSYHALNFQLKPRPSQDIFRICATLSAPHCAPPPSPWCPTFVVLLIGKDMIIAHAATSSHLWSETLKNTQQLAKIFVTFCAKMPLINQTKISFMIPPYYLCIS